MKCQEKLPTYDALDAIVLPYSQSASIDKALQMYSFVLNTYNCVPNVFACNSLLSVLVIYDQFETARGIYEEMIQRNDGVGGKVQEAEELLEQATKRGLFPNKLSCTPILNAYSRQANIESTLSMFTKMMESGEKPNLVTYGSLIHGIVVSGEVDAALTILNKMTERGVLPDAGIYNVLMSGLCKKGRLLAAKKLLSLMLDQNALPDRLIYTTLVDGYIRSGDLIEAKKLFEYAIEKGVNPDVVGYNTIIKGYCNFGMMEDAVSCINKMIRRHVSPDEFTYSTIIDGYAKQNDLDGALGIFALMVKQNFKPNVVTLGSFCKEGKLTKAASFFEQMLMSKCNPNEVTFHYLVNGFSNHVSNEVYDRDKGLHEPNQSIFFDFFRRMISDGWHPRTAAYSSIIACLCLHGMLNTALQLSEKMATRGCLSEPVTFAALLHGVSLEGRSKEWKDLISCNLNEAELSAALRYSMILELYNPHEVSSEASSILQTMVNGYKANLQEVNNLQASKM